MKRRLGFTLAAIIFALFVYATVAASAAWSMERGTYTNTITEQLNAKVTLHTRRALAAEAQAEGGSAKNNLFNTTANAPGATCYNVFPCVKNYPTPEIGIEATVRTLKENGHGYEHIRKCLRSNCSAIKIVKAFGQSEWGTDLQLVLAVLSDIQHSRAPNTLAQLEAKYVSN